MDKLVPKSFRPGMNNPFYIIRKALLRKVKQYAPMLSGKLLDFGCGSKPYQSLFNNTTEYIGLDFEGGGHSHKNENVDVFYDGEILPFANETFDSVFSSEVFEHVFNLPRIIPELHRVMKKGARIFITCPFVWNEHEAPADYARYTGFAMKDMMEKNGFTILAMDKSGDFSSTISQMQMLYFSEHFIPSVPLLGRKKFFKTSVAPVIYFLLNAWFSFKHRVLPVRKDLYLNNILLAQKN